MVWKWKKTQWASHSPSLTTTIGGDFGLKNLSATKWYPDGDHSWSPVPAVPTSIHLQNTPAAGEKKSGLTEQLKGLSFLLHAFPFIFSPSISELLVLTFMLWQR